MSFQVGGNADTTVRTDQGALNEGDISCIFLITITDSVLLWPCPTKFTSLFL